MVAGNPGERTIRRLSYGVLALLAILALSGSVLVRSFIPLILLACLLLVSVFAAAVVIFPLFAVLRGAIGMKSSPK